MKLGSKELSLIIVILGVLVVVFTYQFYFSGYLEKVEKVKTEQSELQADIDKLLVLDANKENIVNETKKVERNISDILKLFPSQIRYEDGIMLMKDFVDDYDIDITSYTVTETTPLAGISSYTLSVGSVDYNYTSTYKNLKSMIRAIYGKNEIKRSIESISISKTDSGVTGSIKLNMYAMDDGTREYTEPSIPSVTKKATLFAN
jgi:hypothetical protein